MTGSIAELQIRHPTTPRAASGLAQQVDSSCTQVVMSAVVTGSTSSAQRAELKIEAIANGVTENPQSKINNRVTFTSYKKLSLLPYLSLFVVNN